MKPSILLIVGIIFTSCRSLRQDVVGVEFISYTYYWTSNPKIIGLRCFRYARIDKNGYVPIYYQWKKYSSNGTLYYASKIEKELVDSILIAAVKQRDFLINNKDMFSLYDGPNLKVMIAYRNGTHDIIDFTMDNILYKYFGAVYNEKNLKPMHDTSDLVFMKHKFIDTIWKTDSTHNMILPPPPPDSYDN